MSLDGYLSTCDRRSDRTPKAIDECGRYEVREDEGTKRGGSKRAGADPKFRLRARFACTQVPTGMGMWERGAEGSSKTCAEGERGKERSRGGKAGQGGWEQKAGSKTRRGYCRCTHHQYKCDVRRDDDKEQDEPRGGMRGDGQQANSF